MSSSVHLIRGMTLIDGFGGEPMRDAAVVVEGDRVAWVGPSGQAPAIGDGVVVDGAGFSLLPGMINCHAHLCNDGAADLFAQVLNDTVPIATIRAVLNARLALRAGVTTIRDCGAASQIALEISSAIWLAAPQSRMVVTPASSACLALRTARMVAMGTLSFSTWAKRSAAPSLQRWA